MIEINLLPEEQRVKAKKSVASPTAGFDPTYLVYLAPAIIGVLLLTHFYLGSVFLFKQERLKALNKEWSSLESQRQKVSAFKDESEASSQDKKIIEELNKNSLKWSEKLNLFSLSLPSGVWFREMAIVKNRVEIKASVFALGGNQMDLINRFISNLRAEKGFLKDFSKVETAGMVTKKLGAYEVMDFTVTLAAKAAAK